MSAVAVAERVGVVVDGDDVYVAHLPDGPILGLSGTAACIWRALFGGPRESLAARVAESIGAQVADIAVDVEAFVDVLVVQGLIELDPAAG